MIAVEVFCHVYFIAGVILQHLLTNQIFVPSCELCIFLVAVLIDIAVAISAVYLNSQRTVVFGCDRLGISFGQHSVELLIGFESIDLDGILDFSSVLIGEVAHQGECFIERVKTEANGKSLGNCVFYHSEAFQRYLESVFVFLIISEVVIGGMICPQI